MEISEYLAGHPELITDELLLAHLPEMFSTSFRDRLKRLPAEYRRAIAAVELAGRIVYDASSGLENEITWAMSK